MIRLIVVRRAKIPLKYPRLKIRTARGMDKVGKRVLVHILGFENMEEAMLSSVKLSFCAWGSSDLQGSA